MPSQALGNDLMEHGRANRVTNYNNKPKRFLERVYFQADSNPVEGVCCAGFEFNAWRCVPFAEHLIEWLPEYALPEEELSVTHGNIYVTLRKAAVRVYTSDKYAKRGEAGEIALHAICPDYFGTLPISNRVFYKSASNDVVKAFDMVHARFPENGGVQLWLGESKLYLDTVDAINEAIKSVSTHIAQGFLTQQKLILGPQIPRNTPNYHEIIELFEPNTSLDKFISSGVFVIGILSNSKACRSTKTITECYKKELEHELALMTSQITKSGLTKTIKIVLVYIPLADKTGFVTAFDKKLKGLQ